MKTSSITKIADYYAGRVRELEDKTIKSHFRHIANNLATLIVGFAQLIQETPELWENVRKDYVNNMISLGNYLRTLEKHPDFKTGELTSEAGYFPDMKDDGENGCKNYVSEARRRLEER